MRYYLALITSLLLVSGFASAQQINLRRYASAWVQDVNRKEEQQVNDNVELANLKSDSLILLIPNNHTVSLVNGNKFIRAYLINNTNDTVGVNRIDATLGQVETEIKVGNEWKLLQRNAGSTCGNSYFKATLNAKSFYTIHLDNYMPGSNISVPFRLAVYIDKQRIISNEIIAQVSKDLFDLAGTPIPPAAF